MYIGVANYAFEDRNPVDFVKFYKKPLYNRLNLIINRIF